MKEPILEPLLRKMRINRVLPYIQKHRDCRLLDIGCGWEARFLRSVEPYLALGVGIDFKAPLLIEGKIRTERLMLTDTLPYADASFDIVTMLAVLEHLDQPGTLLREVRRVLRPEGCMILTVPSKAAKPVLDFLSFRLGLISCDEISDHKEYYDRSSLGDLFASTGFTMKVHGYFQLGMNNFCVAGPLK
jgi:ubiquinone/menaquinone biosynthesis C-methylase UbiE